MPIFSLILFATLFFITHSNASENKKLIQAWTYYEFGPFITDKHKGFTYDFVDLMNKALQKHGLEFEVVVLPRKRLDLTLNKEEGIVLFVNPSWMRDKNQNKYLWSPPFLTDNNAIVSRTNGKSPTKIIYKDLDSLKGMTMGGVLGRSYRFIDKAVADGHIIREDASKESQTLQKLVLGRVDFMTSSNSLIKYMIKDMKIEKDIFISPTPLFEYNRHILVTKQLEKESKVIFKFISELNENPDWLHILKKYDL